MSARPVIITGAVHVPDLLRQDGYAHAPERREYHDGLVVIIAWRYSIGIDRARMLAFYRQSGTRHGYRTSAYDGPASIAALVRHARATITTPTIPVSRSIYS